MPVTTLDFSILKFLLLEIVQLDTLTYFNKKYLPPRLQYIQDTKWIQMLHKIQYNSFHSK